MVITDWLMPDLSGLELCRRIRSDFQDVFTYAILLTSNSDKANIVVGLQSGADEYLTKPFDAAELRARANVGRSSNICRFRGSNGPTVTLACRGQRSLRWPSFVIGDSCLLDDPTTQSGTQAKPEEHLRLTSRRSSSFSASARRS
jgi:DNA-binding response OmpR family regulator